MKINRDKIFIEVSSLPHYPYPERIPSPSDPMGEIHTEGLMLRSLSNGNAKWWVLISGWVFYGIIFLASVAIALSSMSFFSILFMALGSIQLVPLWRGTVKKLSSHHYKS
jgi:hypothetical protein